MLDIVVRSKGLIGIVVVAAEVDIVVAVLVVVGIDRRSSVVGTTEKISAVADTGSRVL